MKKITALFLVFCPLFSLLVGCGPASEGSDSDIEISYAKKNGFAYLEKHQSKPCLVLDGEFSEGEINKTDFKLFEGELSIDCLDLKIKNKTFITYFDLSSVKNSQDVSCKTFSPHLSFKGEDKGLIISSKGKSTYYTPTVSTLNDLTIGLSSEHNVVIYSYVDVTVSLSQSESFASIAKENNNYIFKIKGNYQGKVILSKESLSIVGDDDTGTFMCSDLKLTNKLFEAKFIVNDLTKNIEPKEDRIRRDFYPHLYVNGKVFDNDKGDISNGVTLTRTEVIENNTTFSVHGEYENSMAVLTYTEITTIKFKDFSSNYTYYPVVLRGDNNMITLEICGWFSGNYGDYKAKKEMFKLYDKEISFLPYDIFFEDPGSEYEGGTRFKLYFDLTSLKDQPRTYSEDVETDEFNFWCHIEFNGVNFDNDKGDLRPGLYDGKSDWMRIDKVTYDDNSIFRTFVTYGMIVVNVKNI